MSRTRGGTLAGACFFLTATLWVLPTSGQPPHKKGPEKEQGTPSPAEPGRKKDAPGDRPIPSNRQRNEYGVLGASALHDGGMNLPPDMRVPEQYQYLRPDLQPTAGELTGKQLPPVPVEFKVLTKKVDFGDEVRAVARILSPYNKPRPFVSLFYHTEYGRRSVMYVNFKPSKKDKNLFLGRGKLSKYAAPGRYIVGTTIIADEVGDRKAYWADFHKPMQEEDGSPVGFEVFGENPNMDVTAPFLESVEIETESIHAGEGALRYTVASEDDISGLTEAEAVWVSPNGYQQIRSTMVMLGGKPGVFKGSLHVPKWYEGGEWELMRVSLKDNAGNRRYYFRPTEPKMADAVVHVEQEPEMVDKNPPELLAVQFSTNDAKVGESVTITALAEDDLSGIEAIEGYVRSPNGADAMKVKLANRFVPLNRPSKIPEPGLWTGSFKIKDTMEWGEWRLVRLGVSDKAHNFFTYFEGRDEILGGVKVNFVNEKEAAAKATEGEK